jgi:uncharacterized protein (DUF2461 family)
VADHPEVARRLIDEPRFAAAFGPLAGDTLKRTPTGFPPDHPEVELLKLKDVTFGHRLSDADVMSPDLPDTIADSFEVAVPVMRWLASL